MTSQLAGSISLKTALHLLFVFIMLASREYCVSGTKKIRRKAYLYKKSFNLWKKAVSGQTEDFYPDNRIPKLKYRYPTARIFLQIQFPLAFACDTILILKIWLNTKGWFKLLTGGGSQLGQLLSRLGFLGNCLGEGKIGKWSWVTIHNKIRMLKTIQ